jgi:hypothetical protein
MTRWAPGVNDEGEARINSLDPDVRRLFECFDGGVWRPDDWELKFADAISDLVQEKKHT